MRCTWVLLLKNKSDALQVVSGFFCMIDTQFHKNIKVFRSDNANELQFTDFFLEKGVLHQYSCVERLQQNSVIERKHQHLLNVSELYIFKPDSQPHYGDNAYSLRLITNRTSSTLLHNKPPFEILYQQRVH